MRSQVQLGNEVAIPAPRRGCWRLAPGASRGSRPPARSTPDGVAEAPRRFPAPAPGRSANGIVGPGVSPPANIFLALRAGFVWLERRGFIAAVGSSWEAFIVLWNINHVTRFEQWVGDLTFLKCFGSEMQDLAAACDGNVFGSVPGKPSNGSKSAL